MNVVLLKNWMLEHRLKVEHVASKTGIDYSTIQKILNGTTKRPTTLTVRALANLIGVPEEKLLPFAARRKTG